MIPQGGLHHEKSTRNNCSCGNSSDTDSCSKRSSALCQCTVWTWRCSGRVKRRRGRSMKKVLQVSILVAVGATAVFGLILAALHTIIELKEYYCCRYDDWIPASGHLFWCPFLLEFTKENFRHKNKKVFPLYYRSFTILLQKRLDNQYKSMISF